MDFKVQWTLIGQVAGIRYYEHPVHGDEAPLYVRQDEKMVRSEHWELPDPLENV